MKKLTVLSLLAICILALSGCAGSKAAPDDQAAQPLYPLDEETLAAALEELSLPWVISEEETQSAAEENREYTSYTLRDAETKLNPDSTYTILYAAVTSGTFEGRRRLSVTFDPAERPTDAPFVWDDWKKELTLCARLYGGFADDEEVYRALCAQEIPDDDGRLYWTASLPGGFCAVQRGELRESKPGEYVLWVNFYESEELYEQERQKEAERIEQMQQQKAERAAQSQP